MRRLQWIGFVCLSCLTMAAHAGRHALVVGNDSYTHIAPLKNARADARAMARALEDAGFKVTLKTDLSEKQMTRALRDFRNTIAGGDEAVFFYAGHGVQIGGANYLLPTDLNGEDEAQVRDDAVSLQRVLDDLQEQKARFSLAIIDACRDNPFKGRGRNIGTRGLAPTAAADGQMVIFSAGNGQQALDRLGETDRNPNGLFTRIFVKEMEKAGVPVHETLRNVRDEVVRLARAANHQQVPAIYDQSIGKFYFRRGEVAAVVSAAPVAPAADAAPPKRSEAKAVVAADAGGKSFRSCSDCPEMVNLPEGDFAMGSPNDEAGRSDEEGPVHRVSVAAFALGRVEVTRAQFAAFVRATGHAAGDTCYTFESGKFEARSGRNWQQPGFALGDHHPVACVSWNDAQAYVGWLARKTGKPYRLPSEAEWEYAARAGAKAARPWGNDADLACDFANVGDSTAKNVAPGGGQVHDCSDGEAQTAAGGRYKPNRFGLHDMIGNVWEWTQDCWNDSYAGAPANRKAWTSGDCGRRVRRGGSWYSGPQLARSAQRGGSGSGFQSGDIGFRVALSPARTR